MTELASPKGCQCKEPMPLQRRGEEGLEGLKPFSTALLLVPTAAEVLQDKLPSHAYLPYQRELLEKAAGYLGSAYIDVAPALRQRNAAGEQVYYRTDHHWVTAAAYEGYAAYLSWLGLEPLGIQTISRKP